MGKNYNYDEDRVALQEDLEKDKWMGVVIIVAIVLLFVGIAYLW
jgi:hypothetical protein